MAISLTTDRYNSLLDDAENLFLAHDQELFAVDLDLGSRVFAKENLVAGLDVEREDLPLVVGFTFADRDRLRLPGAFPWRYPG